MEEGSRRGDRFPYERLPTPPLPSPFLPKPSMRGHRTARPRSGFSRLLRAPRPTYAPIHPSVAIFRYSSGAWKRKNFLIFRSDCESVERRREGKKVLARFWYAG